MTGMAGTKMLEDMGETGRLAESIKMRRGEVKLR
jgi:hypothetical protein